MVRRALAGVAQLVGTSSYNQRVAALIPSQDTYLIDHLILVRVHVGSNQSMFLSHVSIFLSIWILFFTVLSGGLGPTLSLFK